MEDCSTVSTWMNQNSLCLNTEKTHLMVARTSQKISQIRKEKSIQVKMDGLQLTESENSCEMLLGVVIEANLKWNKHVQELQKRLKDRLSGLRKLRFVVDMKHRKVVAESIFNSVLTYCITAWGGTSKGNIEQLQAVRLVLNKPRGFRRESLFSIVNWLTVNQLVVFHRILAIYDLKRTNEPEYLAQFVARENIRGKIIIPNINSSLVGKSFIVHGAEMWNSIPENLRKIEKKQIFRSELKTWVLANIPMFL